MENMEIVTLEKKKKTLVAGEIIRKEEFNFAEDEKIKEELYSSSLRILNIGVSAHYELGKEFTEIYRKLGNNKTGTYLKFVLKLGFNPRTVQRYRLRYEWIERASILKKNQLKAREIISLIGYNFLENLESLCKDEEMEKELLEILQEDNISLEMYRAVLTLAMQEKKVKKREKLESFNLKKNLKKIEDLNKKVDNSKLTVEKQKEIEDYLKKIEEILINLR